MGLSQRDVERKCSILTLNTAKSLVWRYFFVIVAARYVVAHAKTGHTGQAPSSVGAVHRFLRDNDEDLDRSFYDRVLLGVRGLQGGLSLEAFGVKASIDLKGAAPGATATKQLAALEDAVATAFTDLDRVHTHDSLVLLIDQLEQVWSGDADSEAMVIGLLLATKKVTDAFGGAVRCVSFLRADIYDAFAVHREGQVPR